MRIVTEPVNPSSSTSSPRRLMTARMHTNRVFPAKGALRRTQRAASTSAQHRAANPTTSGARYSTMTAKYACGDCPPYSDHVAILQDHFNKRIYMIGGIRPGDDSHTPTSDFYLCEVSNMKWTNLTHQLTHNPYPYNPFNKLRSIKPLPAISLPGHTLLRIEGTSYIALFGGYDCDSERVMSDILVIDPEKREWWYLKFEGEGIKTRINPAMVAINDRIYVFGGCQRFPDDDDDDPQPLHCFSIAEHIGQGIWRWMTRDMPYPVSVPINLIFQEACPVYNGTKILLTPGRVTGDESLITFTQDNCFFYHTTNKKFQPATADITGAFPPGFRWYTVFGPLSTQPLRRPQNPAIALPGALAPNVVIIAAYVDIPNTDDIAPEIWHLYLSPKERIECLDIKQKIWDLNSDFQGSVYVDGQVRILGTALTPAEIANRQRRMVIDSDSEDEVRSKATWNTYLDIRTR